MRNFLILIILVFITSCDKKLDLLPRQSVAEDVALSSDANVKKVLNGAYDAVSSGNLWGGNLLLFSELLGADGEIRWEGTFNQPREVFSKAIITTNSFVRDTWLSAYNVVNVSNNIIGAIGVVNEADKNRVKGEALFLRGSMFFELVRLYAKPYTAGNVSSNLGIPLVTTATRKIDESSYVARSTVEQTYAQIVADLTEAESALPNTNGVYANKAAAAAMLSRVYLQMERFADARDAADRAIAIATAAGRNLATTYAAAFNNAANSTEYLFAIQVSALDGANNMHLYWSIPSFGGRDGDVSIQTPHLSLYDPLDSRRALFYSGSGATRSGKWKEQYKILPIIRLAEMYLTRAEANFRLGTSVGATPLQDINRIRQRAGVTPLAVVTLNDILLERKLELAHEGLAIHDRKRLRLTTDGLSFDADKLIFPIPQREIDASNGVLVQNSGY
jgi:starch-binding outer membrane protein, SusD/RagB family